MTIRALLLCGIFAGFGGPLYWLALTSLRTPTDLMSDPPMLLPTAITLDNYVAALRSPALPALGNSLIVAAAVTVAATGLGTLAGYGLARRALGGFALPFAILAVRMLPAVLFIVPFFQLFRAFGLIDHPLAVAAAHLMVTLPFAVWLMRAHFRALPRDLFDAAAMDGCSAPQIFARIALPMAAPGIAVTAFFCFILSWNEFPLALVLTRKDATTLPVLIAMLGEGGAMAAAAAIGALPVLLVAALAYRRLIDGLTLHARL